MIQISNNLTEYNRDNQKLKVAIVKSLYHKDLTQSMEKSCRESLFASGVKNITTFEVPGAWEIPLVAKKIAETKKFDGIIALGIIIKGETYHFELLVNECARTLMDISLKFNIPITFEILATYNLEQARKRSTGKYNKGIEAAKTLIETLKTLSKI
ncbi:MAG: 6,7-dimethyl-8-ribityllumazine synthase [bacterium]|nr:6,7-dimethyl-8-ribityllumazine synthase [bacterium]